MSDVITEMELIASGIISDAHYRRRCERLRLNYLPLAEGLDVNNIEKHQRHLSLPQAEQALATKLMTDDECLLYLSSKSPMRSMSIPSTAAALRRKGLRGTGNGIDGIVQAPLEFPDSKNAVRSHSLNAAGGFQKLGAPKDSGSV